MGTFFDHADPADPVELAADLEALSFIQAPAAITEDKHSTLRLHSLPLHNVMRYVPW